MTRRKLAIFAHLARRDFKDNLLQTGILAALSAVLLFLYARMSLYDRVRSPLPTGYFFVTLMFYTFYLQSIWSDNQSWGASLPRFYLQTLPVRRLEMFVMCFLRGLVGGLPFLAWAFYQLPIQYAMVRFGVPMPLDWGQSAALLFGLLLFMLGIQLLGMSGSLLQEKMRRTSGRGDRFAAVARYFGGLVLDVAALSGLGVGLGARVDLGTAAAVALRLPLLAGGALILAWRLRRRYHAWLWE